MSRNTIPHWIMHVSNKGESVVQSSKDSEGFCFYLSRDADLDSCQKLTPMGAGAITKD